MTASLPHGRSVYLSHPTGNQNSRQLAAALFAQNRLQEFATALAVPEWLTRSSLVPARLREELARRTFEAPGCMRSVARTAEGRRLLRAKLRRPAQRGEIDDLYRLVDERAAQRITRTRPLQVYAYEDGALASFRAGKEIGARNVYELPIGHWQAHRTLCDEENELLPEWAHSWQLQSEPPEKLRRKDQELQLADVIVVPSQFVKSTLLQAGIQAQRIKVVPYGCPSPAVEKDLTARQNGKLRVLFVGGLSQRKGLSYLIAALATLGPRIEVTVIGRGPAWKLLPATWRVIDSLPHQRVMTEMREHDVFVFPTLFEGRSLALAEALASGLILITTPNSGAADLVEAGQNGWLTDIRDAASISSHLEELLLQPGRIMAMKMHSLQLARNNGWEKYRAAMNHLLDPRASA